MSPDYCPHFIHATPKPTCKKDSLKDAFLKIWWKLFEQLLRKVPVNSHV